MNGFSRPRRAVSGSENAIDGDPVMGKNTPTWCSAGDQMPRDQILERIQLIMRNLTDDDNLILVESTTPDDVDLWDSMLHLKLIVALESEFNVRFDVMEIDEPENVRQIIELIESKVSL